jgi:hypothetical protein
VSTVSQSIGKAGVTSLGFSIPGSANCATVKTVSQVSLLLPFVSFRLISFFFAAVLSSLIQGDTDVRQ